MLQLRSDGLSSRILLALNILLYSTTALAQATDPDTDTGDANPQTGNEGPEAGSVNLSKGALVAIGIAVGAAVILGTTTAILFYLAKKRQWEVRKTLRRTATRVVEVMTPKTPKKMTFSPAVGKPNRARFPEADDPEEEDDDEYPITNSRRGKDRDLEKGRTAKVVPINPDGTVRGGGKKKSRPANINVPTSEFEMESPKTPMVAKIFGRK